MAISFSTTFVPCSVLCSQSERVLVGSGVSGGASGSSGFCTSGGKHSAITVSASFGAISVLNPRNPLSITPTSMVCPWMFAVCQVSTPCFSARLWAEGLGCVRWLLEPGALSGTSSMRTTPSSSLISLSVETQTIAMIVGGVTGVFGPLATIGMDFFSRYLATSSTRSSESRLISIQIASPVSSRSPADRCASCVASRSLICCLRCDVRTRGVSGGSMASCGTNVPWGFGR